MQPRFSYIKSAPEAHRAMRELGQAVAKGPLPKALIELIDMRVSQINGCAFCLDMHSKDLRAGGESEQRIYLLSAWREAAHLYTEKERAALAWAEAVTTLEGHDVPDAVYEEARRHFGEEELAFLTLAVVAINGWNRLNVAFRTPAGNYQPAAKRPAA